MIKRAIILVCLLSAAFTLRADEKSKSVLQKLTSTITSYTSYQVDFTATMDGEFKDVKGKFIVNGPKFYLDVHDSEIYFDGKVGYNYTKANNEVIIEDPDPNDDNILANPARIFQLYDKDFTHIFKGTATVNGRTVNVVELTPKMPNGSFEKVLLKVDAATSLPVSVSYQLADYDKKMELRVVKVTPNVPVSVRTFTFDPKKYPGVEVIDFRNF